MNDSIGGRPSSRFQRRGGIDLSPASWRTRPSPALLRGRVSTPRKPESHRRSRPDQESCPGHSSFAGRPCPWLGLHRNRLHLAFSSRFMDSRCTTRDRGGVPRRGCADRHHSAEPTARAHPKRHVRSVLRSCRVSQHADLLQHVNHRALDGVRAVRALRQGGHGVSEPAQQDE